MLGRSGTSTTGYAVMPALGAGIHAFGAAAKAWMPGPKSGHDVAGICAGEPRIVAIHFDPNRP
jgi:hypothetical protein